MAESNNGQVVSFKAAAVLAPYRVVCRSAADQVGYWATQSSNILGVTMEASKQTEGSIPVVIAGIALVACGASIPADAIVGPSTDGSGVVVERANGDTITTKFNKTLGIALEAGSANSIIRVLLQPSNKSQLG